VNTAIAITVSPGEYWDRVTILCIKAARVKGDDKKRLVQDELNRLASWQLIKYRPLSAKELVAQLETVNGKLWSIEDSLRRWEADKTFGSQFISAARQVYTLNDERSALKRAINEAYGTPTTEVKELPVYV